MSPQSVVLEAGKRETGDEAPGTKQSVKFTYRLA